MTQLPASTEMHERSVEEQRAQHQLLLSEQRQLDELGVELQRQEQLRHSARARERLQEQHQKLQQQRNDLLRRQAAGRLQHASRNAQERAARRGDGG